MVMTDSQEKKIRCFSADMSGLWVKGNSFHRNIFEAAGK